MNDAPPPPPEPPGPDALRRHFVARDGFMRTLGIEVLDLGRGTSRLAMSVGPQHLNFNGTCHGGAVFALADSAFGLASNSHGVLAAGIDTHTTFSAAARSGDRLIATATETSRSRRLAVYRVEVAIENGAAVAGFTGTVYIIGQSHEV